MTTMTHSLTLARARIDEGDYLGALHMLQHVLAGNPQSADALMEIGRIALLCQDYSNAIDYHRRAVELSPTSERYFHLGVCLHSAGQTEQAIQAYRQCLSRDPQHIQAWENLGVAEYQAHATERAVEAFHQALAIDPRRDSALTNLAEALRAQGKPGEAAESCRRALALDPGNLAAHLNLGLACADEGRYEPAIIHYQQVLKQEPDHEPAMFALARALAESGQTRASLQWFERLLARAPDNDHYHHEYSLVLLLHGDLARGWDENVYRYRLPKVMERAGFNAAGLVYPQWDGSSLHDKTLFIYREQGIGDEVQYASCIPDLIPRSRQLIVECHSRLAPIFARSFPGVTVHAAVRDDRRPWLAQYPIDCQTSVHDLPRFTRRTFDDFPPRVQYLYADARRVTHWRREFERLGPDLKIGISWRGGADAGKESTRSTRLADWLPVLSLPGVCLVNLQYGDCRDELAAIAVSHGITIHHWPEIDQKRELENVCAQITALDLVITVGNSIAHLAGALGTPVWTLLPRIPAWKWFMEGEHYPWYPRMRLFRQEHDASWPAVMQRVADQLKQRLTHHRHDDR